MSGVITLSMEIELGWGVHDKTADGHLSDDGSAERTYLGRLLDHCDELDIPITFDVVGHLLHATCDGSHDGPHRDGWFESDPGTDVRNDPLFYAPEIVPEITSRPTSHELATHTYSHVPCRNATSETVAWELETAQRQLHRTTGSPSPSLVPPRHSRPPATQLRESDIEVMRMSKDTSDRSLLSRLYELVIGPHPEFDRQLALVDGVLETYCTEYPSLTSSALPAGERPPPAPFRALPVRLRQHLQRQYLRRTIATVRDADSHCHLWCHLYDLSNEYQWPVVKGFLSELADRRDRGEVAVVTMAELPDTVPVETIEARAGD